MEASLVFGIKVIPIVDFTLVDGVFPIIGYTLIRDTQGSIQQVFKNWKVGTV